MPRRSSKERDFAVSAGGREQLIGVAIFAVVLAMAVPLFAQEPETTLDQNCQTQGLTEYQKAVKANPQSSLAHYCVAVLLFGQQLDRLPNRWSVLYQVSANAYRNALNGDGNPKWTKVWSYIGLGKIFDVTEQRERAVAQYQLAVQTNDNTRGAVDEARELLLKPYRLPDIR
jgi:tetratricopeptide (TPR) repeat protein